MILFAVLAKLELLLLLLLLLLAVNGSVDEWTALSYRDVYEDNRGLAVLRGTKMPAIITETGYMSSKDIEYMIDNTENIANGIGHGICEYYVEKNLYRC